MKESICKYKGKNNANKMVENSPYFNLMVLSIAPGGLLYL
jgi:hypothetical protein